MIDKELKNWSGYSLNTSGDLQTVEWIYCNLQAAQIRILSEKWSWLYDDDFWSFLMKELRENTPILVTENYLKGIVELAIQPLIDDGRVKELLDLKILEKTSESITIEMKIKLDTTVVITTYNITI